MLFLATLLCLGVLLALGGLLLWRRLPMTVRAELEGTIRALRLRSGTYSLKLVMQGMTDDMRGSVLTSVRKSYVPNRMVFGMHPLDARRWGGYFDRLADELVAIMLDIVEQRADLHLAGTELAVVLQEDQRALPGRPTFAAQMTAATHDGRTVSMPTEGATTALIRSAADDWTLTIDGGSAIAIDRQLVLGRGGDADVRLDGEGISRMHASLEPLGEHVRLIDLESTNGTWLNGERVSLAQVQPEDVVRLGSSTMLTVSRMVDRL
jgi:hypothetical protein